MKNNNHTMKIMNRGFGCLAVAAFGLLALSAPAADYIKADTTSLTTTTDWTTAIVPGPADIGEFNATISSAHESALILSNNLTVGDFQFDGTLNGAVTIGATTNTLTLNGVGGLGIDMTSANQNVTMNNQVVLGASQTWNVTSGRTLTIGGSVGDGGNGYGLTNAGSGTLVLLGTNTYGGLTTVSAGTLQIGNGGATGTLPGAAFVATTLNFDRNDLAASPYILGGSIYGAGTVNVASGAVQLNQSAGAYGINKVSGASGTTTILAGNSASSTSVTNAMSAFGAGTLSINSGTWIYAVGGGRNFSGNALNINGGTLQIGTAAANGNRLSFSGASQQLNVHAGGFLNVSNSSYGMRLGGDSGSGSGQTGANFTGVQDGGIVSITGEPFNLGNSSSGGLQNSYTLSGGLLTMNSSSISLGADTAGSSTTTFTLSGSGKIYLNGSISGAQGAGAQQIFNFAGGTLVAGTVTATALASLAAPTVQGTLYNNGGTLAPGDLGTPGKTSLTGNYTINSGTLAIDIGGASAASSFTNLGSYYDFVSVSGAASLGGNLNINLINGYTPPANTTTFTILTASGGFAGTSPANFANNYGGYFIASQSPLKYMQAVVIGNNLVLTNYGVIPPALVASFTPTNAIGVAPYAVSFTDTSVGAITNRYWNFGDGNTLKTEATSVSHTYALGIFTNILTIYAADGSSSSATGKVYSLSSAPTLVWKGDGTVNAWDTATKNWLYSGVASAYGDPDSVIFDDTGSVTPNVSLNFGAQPASVTFNNSTKNYTFGGSGGLNGSASVALNGTGTVTLLMANAYTGPTVINSGTLQVGNNTTSGSIDNSSALTNNGALILTQTGSHSISGIITGSGSLTKAGTGTLTLGAADNSATFSGTITNNGGTLAAATDNTLGGPSVPVTLNNGTLQYNTLSAFTLNRSLTLTGTNDGLNLNSAVILPNPPTVAGLPTMTLGGSGSLQIDTGGSSVSLPTNVVLNGASLIYQRSDDYAQPGVITGNSSASSIYNQSTPNGNTNTLTFADGFNAFGSILNTSAGELDLDGSPNSTNTLGGTGGLTYSANAMLVVNGGTFTVTGARVVGSSAATSTGTLIVNGGTVNSSFVSGNNGGSENFRGNLILNGGTFHVTSGRLSLTDPSGSQMLAINGGNLLIDNSSGGGLYGLRLGNDNGAGIASGSVSVSATQTGGNVVVNGQELDLGGAGAATDSYVLSGGNIVVTNSNTGTGLLLGAINGGGVGIATFTLTNTGKLFVNNTVQGSQSGSAQQVFDFEGGTLVANAINATHLCGLAAPSVQGTLYNVAGTLAPGDLGTPGKTTITGNYACSNASTLAIDIGGPYQATAFQNGSTNYDFVSVSGAVALGGTLGINLINGFTPAATNGFTILTAGGGFTAGPANFANNYGGYIIVSQSPLEYMQAKVIGNNLVLTNYGVTPPALAASFTPTNATGLAPFLATFTDTSVGAITNRFWNFGDGGTLDTTATNVSYTYNSIGVYTNILTVYAANGATSSATGIVHAVAATVNLTWKGDGVANVWNTSTLNWLNGGTPALYADPDDVTFDDTGSSTPAVQLNFVAQPDSVTFNNSAENYTISGTGGIDSSASLTLNGTGMVTLLTANPYTGPTAVNSGTLQVGNGTTSGSIDNSSGITDNGALIFDQPDNHTVAGSLNGSGSLTKAGSGTLTLAGDAGTSAFGGTVTVNGGTLVANSTLGNGSALAFSQGGVFSLTDVTPVSLSRTVLLTNGGGGFSHSAGLDIPFALTGQGPFIKGGGGLMTLDTANTYTGGTIINGGTVEVGVTGLEGATLGAVGPLTMATGSTLTYNTTVSQTNSPVDAAGATIVNNNSNAIITLAETATNHTVGAVSGVSGVTNILTGVPGAVTTINGVAGVTALGVAGMLAQFTGGTWYDTSSGSQPANVEIDNGSLILPAGGINSQWLTPGQTLTIHGGSLISSNSYGLRLANTFGANAGNGASGPFTGVQDGGLVLSASGDGLQWGSDVCTNFTYTLSGGTVQLLTSAGPLNLGANTNGSGANVFTLSGTGKLLAGSSVQGATTNAPSLQVFAFTGGILSAATFNATYLRPTVASPEGTLVNNGGTLAPGDIGTAGRTVITGNYVVSNSAAVLSIDLGGTAPANAFQNTNNYDLVTVSGNVVLAGSLNLNEINGFEPIVGQNDTFTIMTAANITGAFANVPSGSRLALTGYPNRSFRVTVTATSVVLDQYQTTTPQAYFTYSPNSGSTPLAVTFTNLSNGAGLTNLWSFGDGGTSVSTAATVTHTYTSAGTNTVSLTVGDSLGVNNYTVSNAVVVTIPSGPTGNPVLTNSLSGTTLTLSWGAGWLLAAQTNPPSAGLSSTWVTNTTATSPQHITMDPSKGSVFYKLVP